MPKTGFLHTWEARSSGLCAILISSNCQLGTVCDYIRREFSDHIGWWESCGVLSWLLFDVGGPSPLWELPPLKTWTWLYKKASSASASEPAYKQHPLKFQLQFLDWEQVSWLEVILHGIAGKPAFGFLLELLHWLLLIMDSDLQAEINPFPPLWRFWSECFIPATEKKPEHLAAHSQPSCLPSSDWFKS